MSERQAKKSRYNQKLDYIARFEKWMRAEPPKYRIVSWLKWKNRRPVKPF